MKVFVTGGSGFLGRQLVKRLLGAGHDVNCLARDARGARSIEASVQPPANERLTIFVGNLNSGEGLATALRGCEVVFHLAAEARGAAAVLFLTNVVAVRRLIALAGTAGARRFVLVSSLGVYGTAGLPQGGCVDEGVPVEPVPERRDAYTYSKVVQELVAVDCCREQRLPLVVVRPGVLYGPGRDYLSGRVGVRFGRWMLRMGGGQRLPYTFVDNCADAVLLAGFADGACGQAFNVVDDELPTGRELLRRYRRNVRRVRVVPVPEPAIPLISRWNEWYCARSAGQVPAVLTPYKSASMWKRLRYSNAKAKAVLGWKPRVGLREGLARSEEWLRKGCKPNDESRVMSDE
jgi:nucleoside-diphosphate-sugar epimerase